MNVAAEPDRASLGAATGPGPATVTVRSDLVAERAAAVRARLEKAGGEDRDVRIVAVTKGFGPDAVIAARAAGLADVGENYAQELEAKALTAPPGTAWHFLGSVQRNKVAALAPLVACWHALDRDAAVDAVAARAPGASVFIQLNPFGDPAKHGCAPQAAPALAQRCRAAGLDLRGLMVVGVAGDPEATRRAFQLTARWAAQVGVRELSMGMSDDFEMAVAEGATTLRLGRVLFGPRPG